MNHRDPRKEGEIRGNKGIQHTPLSFLLLLSFLVSVVLEDNASKDMP